MAHTLARRLADYLGGLTVLSGDLAGQPLTVFPWEKRFLSGAFAVPGDVSVSIGRGNGKSGFVAGIATAAVDPDGPLHFGRADVVVVASSFDQSRIIFEDVLSYLREKYELERRLGWRIQDSANRATLEHVPTGSRVRCIGSDPRRAHGLRPALVLADEPAQWEGTKADAMLAALRTGLGKIPNSRLMALGTRPADEQHWFAKMLAGGAAYSQCHAAGRDDPKFQMRTWRKANPSLPWFPTLEQRLREEAADAKMDPALLSSFEALRLNLGVPDTDASYLLSADLWKSIEGEAERAGAMVWGVDLGTSAAQSAVAPYWPDSGRLEVFAAFPREPDLRKRGQRDGVGQLYQLCARRGELIQCGGAAVDIRELLATALERYGKPARIVADRWREPELRDALQQAGVPRAALELRGMGYKDGAADVRGFRRACVDGSVVPAKSLLLRSSMGEARTVTDPAGNSKLAKNTQGGRRARARDDAAAAAVLAVAAGHRRPEAPPQRWRVVS